MSKPVRVTTRTDEQGRFRLVEKTEGVELLLGRTGWEIPVEYLGSASSTLFRIPAAPDAPYSIATLDRSGAVVNDTATILGFSRRGEKVAHSIPVFDASKQRLQITVPKSPWLQFRRYTRGG